MKLIIPFCFVYSGLPVTRMLMIYDDEELASFDSMSQEMALPVEDLQVDSNINFHKGERIVEEYNSGS